MIAEVIVDIENKQVNRSFDYLIPSSLEGLIKVGFRVLVPFGRLKRVGYVVGIKENTDYTNDRLKNIIEPIDYSSVLNEEFINIGKYIAENYFSFYATTYNSMIPAALKIKYRKFVEIVNDDLPLEFKELFKKNKISLNSIPADKISLIYKEISKGNLVVKTEIKKRKNDKVEKIISLIDSTIPTTSKKQSMLVDYLTEIGEDTPLDVILEDSGFSKSVVDSLEKNGIIRIYERKIEVENSKNSNLIIKNVELNNDQIKVFNSVEFNKSTTYLLHGVTGSGKTEVYMRLIKKAIDDNKKALLLVPEISLTPQITAILEGRFGNDIAILHSRLTVKEKYDMWQKIINRKVKIIVGARSAIFAPIDNLGIIIIDEEHENSYIQQNNPKYNAIDIALIRSKNHNCPLILGSATPNVSDYYKALEGEYTLLSLPNRANGKPLPKSDVIDMRSELMNGNRSPLSYELQKSLKDCYNRNEQSILFLNRRGFSSFVMCRSCGETIKCPHCDVSLTYHKRTNNLKCHYCGYQTINVIRCPKCSSDKIRFVGNGTEKIEEAVKNLIPEAKTIRLDVDTTSSLSDYEDAYFKFKNHEADILIGTQMVAKGLDFELVTLVGVVNADLALNYPTFDASSVAFNLIEQVSGRAGRDKSKGRVIIQTYNPDHKVILSSSNHNYEEFYSWEIERRKVNLLPPFAEIVEITISSKDKNLAFKEANIILRYLKKDAETSLILGPAEDYIFKKNDIYTYKLQIQLNEECVLNNIRYIYPLYQDNKDVNVSISRM